MCGFEFERAEHPLLSFQISMSGVVRIVRSLGCVARQKAPGEGRRRFSAADVDASAALTMFRYGFVVFVTFSIQTI